MPVFLHKPQNSKSPMTVNTFKAKHLHNYFCLIKHNDNTSDNRVYNLTFFKDENKKDERFISPNGEFHFKWSDVLAFEENNGDNLVCSPLENNKHYVVTLFNGLTHTLRCKDNEHPYKVPLFVSDDGSIQFSLSDLSFVQDVN